MSSFLLALSMLAVQSGKPLKALDGVWADSDGRVAVIVNGQLDWQIDDRFYSAPVRPMEDGSFLGDYICGRELKFGEASGMGGQGYAMIVSPDTNTFASPTGRVRVLVKYYSPKGAAQVIRLDQVREGSRTPDTLTFVRLQPLSALSIAGKYGGKDLLLELRDSQTY